MGVVSGITAIINPLTQELTLKYVLLAIPTLAFAALFIYTVIDYSRVLALRRRMPPGPFPWPLVGNHFHIPVYKPWEHWLRMSEVYKSDMLTYWNGNRPILVVNSAEVASDLMEKRAAIYSSRPRLVMLGDAIGQTGKNQVVLEYGDKWRDHRRLFHTAVGTQAIRAHRGFQSNESKILIRDVMLDNLDYVMAIERYSCSVASIVGWGRRIDRMNDYVAKVALMFMENVDFVLPGVYLMDALPFLRFTPKWIWSFPTAILEGTRHMGRYFYALTQEAANDPKKEGDDIFAKRMLKTQRELGMDNYEIAGMMGNLIGGGVDTTTSTIISFIMAMCVFTDVQKKAHEELDRVVGRDRSPNWTDFDDKSLPYISAIVKETLRWRSVAILGGLPHAPIRDDMYKGYLIPEGTSVTGNLWGIHRDPKYFPQPDLFEPGRFFEDHPLHRPYPIRQGYNTFGWGRRVCSGQPLAEQGLFAVLARMLWAFDLKPGLDENGKEVKLDIFAYSNTENMRALPFKARFLPRTPGIRELVIKEAEKAREELRIYDGESSLTLENVF
ncbi:cytochrome P450 [Xylogone sp. PMI_703]|nr:cytochrome P450 [Xylogone sp. PMI_703]